VAEAQRVVGEEVKETMNEKERTPGEITGALLLLILSMFVWWVILFSGWPIVPQAIQFARDNVIIVCILAPFEVSLAAAILLAPIWTGIPLLIMLIIKISEWFSGSKD
jgi:hypothetical protein